MHKIRMILYSHLLESLYISISNNHLKLIQHSLPNFSLIDELFSIKQILATDDYNMYNVFCFFCIVGYLQ